MGDEQASATRGGPVAWLSRQLRITAARDVLRIVEVKRAEIAGLIALAIIYAITDGVGLSVLLPVLQYAEDGSVALGGGTSIIFTWPAHLAASLGVPLNLVTLLVFAFVPVVLRQIAYFLNTWYSSLVSNRVAVRMRIDTYERLMAADPDFFTTRPQGEFTGAVIHQTVVAGQAVLLIIKLLSVLLQVMIYVGILAVLSLPLTALAAASGLLVSWILRKNMLATKGYGRTVTDVTQQAYSAIIERIALSRLVKMRAEEQRETANVEAYSLQAATASVAIARLGAVVEVTADPLLMLAAFAMLYLGITTMGLKLAALGMLLYVLTRLNSKIKDFNTVRQSISASMPGVMLVNEIREQAHQANTIEGGSLTFEGLRSSIEIDDVWFRFPGAPQDTLKGISTSIQAGSFIAIVGRSGAGKTSLVELLPRLRDVTGGAIRFDGTDIREFEISSLRRGIGYLTQDPMLFNHTVRSNLLYGIDRHLGDEDLRGALAQAHAEFVYALPEGLETRLGDRGVRFSGGERQRLALARAVLATPSLLILDEPTSALDSESERHVQEALAGLHGTTTVIVIAHRLATVMAADQLLVMDEGRIVQRGTHDELVSQDGPYKHLFESQLIKG